MPRRCGTCGSGWLGRWLVACREPASERYWVKPDAPACELWTPRPAGEEAERPGAGPPAGQEQGDDQR